MQLERASLFMVKACVDAKNNDISLLPVSMQKITSHISKSRWQEQVADKA